MVSCSFFSSLRSPFGSFQFCAHFIFLSQKLLAQVARMPVSRVFGSARTRSPQYLHTHLWCVCVMCEYEYAFVKFEHLKEMQ